MSLVPPYLPSVPERWEHLGGLQWGRVGSTGAGGCPPQPSTAAGAPLIAVTDVAATSLSSMICCVAQA